MTRTARRSAAPARPSPSAARSSSVTQRVQRAAAVVAVAWRRPPTPCRRRGRADASAAAASPIGTTTDGAPATPARSSTPATARLVLERHPLRAAVGDDRTPGERRRLAEEDRRTRRRRGRGRTRRRPRPRAAAARRSCAGRRAARPSARPARRAPRRRRRRSPAAARRRASRGRRRGSRPRRPRAAAGTSGVHAAATPPARITRRPATSSPQRSLPPVHRPTVRRHRHSRFFGLFRSRQPSCRMRRQNAAMRGVEGVEEVARRIDWAAVQRGSTSPAASAVNADDHPLVGVGAGVLDVVAGAVAAHDRERRRAAPGPGSGCRCATTPSRPTTVWWRRPGAVERHRERRAPRRPSPTHPSIDTSTPAALRTAARRHLARLVIGQAQRRAEAVDAAVEQGAAAAGVEAVIGRAGRART